MTTNDFDAEGAIHDSNPAAGGARTSPEASPIPPRTTEHPEGGGQGAVPPLSGAARYPEWAPPWLFRWHLRNDPRGCCRCDAPSPNWECRACGEVVCATCLGEHNRVSPSDAGPICSECCDKAVQRMREVCL